MTRRGREEGMKSTGGEKGRCRKMEVREREREKERERERERERAESTNKFDSSMKSSKNASCSSTVSFHSRHSSL